MWDVPEGTLQAGDIFRLINGSTSLYKEALTLYANRNSRLERVGDFTMIFAEEPNMSGFRWEKTLRERERGRPEEIFYPLDPVSKQRIVLSGTFHG